MKYTAPVLAALVALVSAQDLSSIPACAKTCIDDAVKSATSCGATDVSCICASLDAVTQAATGCVLGACGIDVALNEVIPATTALCANAGEPAEPAPVEPVPAESAPAEPAPAEPTPTTPAGGDDEGKDDEDTPAEPEPSAPAEVTPAPSASVSASKSVVVVPTSTTATRPPVVTGGAASFGASLALVLGVAAVAL
ncbi:hypothetical protein OQA88_13650 [Cercophora sp. LCS_1]